MGLKKVRRQLKRHIVKALLGKNFADQFNRMSRLAEKLPDTELDRLSKLENASALPTEQFSRDLNIKFFGYEMARQLADSLPVRENLKPMHVGLQSKPSTQEDLESDWAACWAGELKFPIMFHRKLWEFCYVLQGLYENDMLKEGRKGIGFGCGVEPLPSYFAAKGVDVTVTDLDPGEQIAQGWASGKQHTQSIDHVFNETLVDRETFDKRVSLQYVDMNAIPDSLQDYDFCWSICALEHLGSIDKGLDFIENSMNVLRPGGIAIHTTEFNFLRDIDMDNNWTVMYRKKHFISIARRLEARGYTVAPLNFDVGAKPMDRFIDIPPFAFEENDALKKQWGEGHNHIKLAIEGFPATCFGLIIRKEPTMQRADAVNAMEMEN